MNHKRLSLVALVLLVAAVPASAEPKAGSAELPVTRIVLFSSGVGYFQRDGEVDGNARIDLQFAGDNINDLLKSLVLQDQGGGRVSTVNYDNRDPIEKTLKSFAIDLTSNPSMGELLNQARGERIEVVRSDQLGALTGIVVGVQKVKKPVGKDQVIEGEQLNVLTSEGLQGIDLAHVQRTRFLKPELEQEFRKALEVLATGHDKQKKTVTLNFLGNRRRAVRVAYITEHPIWKTSYRLSLDKDNKAFLQGWAIVENTTDEDWNQVSLGLISGRPISFRMDLYQPLYVPRPLVEPELFASLRPPSYSGNLALEKKDVSGVQGRLMQKQGQAFAPSARRANGASAARTPPAEALAEAENLGKHVGINMMEGVASAAVATELGEYFQYQIEHPVTLSRQKSALLPIVNGPVEASRVSIFNESVHGKFPLLGLRFKNTTGLHLMQGPITVFDQSSYAGDARVTDFQPNETRLVSYAVDLGTEVQAGTPQPAEALVTVKIFKGTLHATYKIRHTKRYAVKNRSEHERVVLIEHPYRPELTLLTPQKPAEHSRDVYRFEVKAETNKPVKLEVVEEQKRRDEIVLTNCDDDTVRIFLRSESSSAAIKKALEEVLKLRSQLAATQKDILREEQALHVIEQDQSRMRANMERVPQTSEAYKRYLKKFDDQETEIEKGRARIAKLQENAQEQKKALEAFLLGLNLGGPPEATEAAPALKKSA
jgi:hypothetical protein